MSDQLPSWEAPHPEPVDVFRRFVTAMQRTPVRVTYALIALNVAFFAAEVALGGDARALFRLGASYPPDYPRELWRLGAAMFLHAGLPHIGFNMWALYAVGPFVEKAYGRASFAGMYAASGFVGFALSAYAGGHLAVGASGAIFGCFAAMPAAFFRLRKVVPPQIFRRVMTNAAITIGINLAYGLSNKQIDNWGHLGGLATGAILGALLPIEASGKRLSGGQRLVALLPAAALVVCLGFAAFNAVAGPVPD